MKVYVIEKGSYSDRHVVGVTETKKEAEEVCKAISGKYKYEKASYTEYDTKQFQINQIRFQVSYLCNEWEAEYDDYDFYEEYKENTEVYEDFYIIYANSPAKAIKIAQDMRAEKLAKKEEII